MAIPTNVKRAGLVVGAVIGFGSKVLDALDAASLGLSFDWWMAIGAAVFFVSVGAMVWHSEAHIDVPGPAGPQDPSGAQGAAGPAGASGETGPSGQSSIGMRGDVVVRFIPGPESPPQTPYVQFTTEGEIGRFIKTEVRPRALRFVTLNRIVREQDLPVDIPCGKGTLTLKLFTKDGFAFDEQNTIGDRLRVEVYPEPESETSS